MTTRLVQSRWLFYLPNVTTAQFNTLHMYAGVVDKVPPREEMLVKGNRRR